MTNCQEVRVKLTITQINTLKSAAKNKTGTISRINMKNVQDVELSHELFLTTRQTPKIRNVFASNMSTDIKLRCKDVKLRYPKKCNPMYFFVIC